VTAPTITPTAIDAFVSIEWIQVVGRHRKDLGDLAGLMDSIADVDLLNPVTLTRDGRLVAGQRRLEACRRLGWAEIPVRFVDRLDDAARLLRAERDENTERKEMLPSEKASLGKALEEIERPAAAARMLAGRPCGYVPTGSDEPASGKVRDLVGEALGMHGRTYEDLRFVSDLANDEEAPAEERVLAQSTLAAMDAGAGIIKPTRKLRQALRAKRDAQEVKANALADPEPEPKPAVQDPNWVPAPHDNRQVATERRSALIRELADEGMSSYQIADRIGVRDIRVREIARENGIRLPADEAMGRGTRKKIDSNRIVRETVAMFDGLEMAVRLINYDDLDRAEIQNWTDSLSEAIRVLNRLNRRLKEMAQ
jgi:ParB family chromosome partitioning protein